MSYVKRMYRFMYPYMFLFVLGMFLYSVQSYLFSFFLGFLASNVLAGVLANDTSVIMSGVLLSTAIMVGVIPLVGFGIIIGQKANLNAERDLKRTLFRAFVQSDLESSQSKHSGAGIAAINEDANNAMGIWRIDAVLMPTLQVVLSIITVAVINWRVGLAAVGLGVIAFLMQIRFIKPIAKLSEERLKIFADMTKSVSDIHQGAVPIRAFNMQDTVLENTASIFNAFKLIRFREAFISMWQRLFTTVQGWLTIVITFGFGGWLVANGELELSVLLLIFPMLSSITGGMSNIGEVIGHFQAPLIATKRIFAIIDSVPDAGEKGSMDFDGSALHIKDLSFKYKNAESNTLHNITLDINPGEMVAFVGPSGSGKSTILRIIVGFYEREQLGMSLSGTSADTVSISSWREKFAYVDQSCKLFDMTIKENIKLGKKGNVADTDIESAAKQAFAHDFIVQLEEQYDTPCGEKGGSLSGGQKQRIAIARALIKGAPILVFDEATSALDPDSERYVMETVESLRSDRTILITTHNLSTIRTADKIVVMDKGKVVDIGTHDALMEKKGLYFDLVTESE